MTQKQINLLEIVREVFPDISDEDAQAILWNCTGWPNFFPYGKTEEYLKE